MIVGSGYRSSEEVFKLDFTKIVDGGFSGGGGCWVESGLGEIKGTFEANMSSGLFGKSQTIQPTSIRVISCVRT